MRSTPQHALTLLLLLVALLARGVPAAPAMPVTGHAPADSIVFVPCGGGAMALDLETGRAVGLEPAPAGLLTLFDCCEDCSLAKGDLSVGMTSGLSIPPAARHRDTPTTALPVPARAERDNHARAPPNDALLHSPPDTINRR